MASFKCCSAHAPRRAFEFAFSRSSFPSSKFAKSAGTTASWDGWRSWAAEKSYETLQVRPPVMDWPVLCVSCWRRRMRLWRSWDLRGGTLGTRPGAVYRPSLCPFGGKFLYLWCTTPRPSTRRSRSTDISFGDLQPGGFKRYEFSGTPVGSQDTHILLLQATRMMGLCEAHLRNSCRICIFIWQWQLWCFSVSLLFSLSIQALQYWKLSSLAVPPAQELVRPGKCNSSS